MFDFSKNKNEEISLLIDIGNGSIGGAFVLFKERSVPKILYNVRLPFAIVDSIDSSKLLSNMESLLEETLSNLFKKSLLHKDWEEGSKKISSVLVSFSSPWFISKTKNIHIKEDKPFIISRKFLDNILEKEERSFKGELIEGKASMDQFNIIEKSIVHTKINGYALDKSIGKKTDTFDLTVYMGVIPVTVYNKVNTKISEYIHIPPEKIIIHTFPLISFTVLRDIYPDSDDFMIMDVTGEVTELTLVKDNSITQTISFPSGRNFVIRQIAKTFNVPPEIAESTLHLFNSNKTDESTSEMMKEILTNIEKEWAIYFEDTLLKFISFTPLPKILYMTSEQDISKLFLDFLKLSKADSTSDYRKNIEPIYIDQEKLESLCQKNKTTMSDEFITILSVFYNKTRNTYQELNTL
ncbi:MAG: hypothetical protein WAX85_02640 [Minisyncoccia bacterium]